MVPRESMVGLYLAAVLCGLSMAQCLYMVTESYEMLYASDAARERSERDDRFNCRTDLFNEFSMTICLCLE